MTPEAALAYLRAQVEEAQKIRAEATAGPFETGEYNQPIPFSKAIVVTAPAYHADGKRIRIVAACGDAEAGLRDASIRDADFLAHSRNTDPWAALKVMAEALHKAPHHPDCLEKRTASGDCWCGTLRYIERALVSAAEALKGATNGEK